MKCLRIDSVGVCVHAAASKHGSIHVHKNKENPGFPQRKIKIPKIQQTPRIAWKKILVLRNCQNPALTFVLSGPRVVQTKTLETCIYILFLFFLLTSGISHLCHWTFCHWPHSCFGNLLERSMNISHTFFFKKQAILLNCLAISCRNQNGFLRVTARQHLEDPEMVPLWN